MRGATAGMLQLQPVTQARAVVPDHGGKVPRVGPITGEGERALPLHPVSHTVLARLFDVAARTDQGRRHRAPCNNPLTPWKYHRVGESRRPFLRGGLGPPSTLGTPRGLPRGNCIVRPAGRLGNYVVGDGGERLVDRIAGVRGLSRGLTAELTHPGRDLH